MDREAVLLVRDKAYRFIQADKEGLWKLWHEAKTEHDRELIMTHAVFCQSFDRGYHDGWNDGHAYAKDVE